MKNLIFPLIFPPLQNEILLPEKAAGQEVQQSERWEAFSWGRKEGKRVYNSCYSNRLDSLHSPHNDQLLVIASEAKQSSFSHSSLRTQWSNPSTKQLCLPMDCFGRFTPSQRRFAYQWIATAHFIRLAMTNSPSLRTKWSNPTTKQIYLQSGLPRLIAFASQWQVTRSFHSFAKTANRSFILYDQFAHKVPLNCHYYQTECPLTSGRRGYSLY